MTTKEQIIEDLRMIYKSTGKIPTYNEYKENGTYCINTVTRKFKKWNDALMEAFGEINHSYNIDKNEKCYCGNTFIKKDKGQIYCSRKCSAKVNNKKAKRIRKKKCKVCQELILSPDTYCEKCYSEILERQSYQIENTPLSFYFDKYKDARKYNQIRMYSKRKMKNEKYECANCHYSKHVEVCHKKQIKDFPKDALVKEINSKDNLIYLCPNCHWEMDHGLLNHLLNKKASKS